MATLKRIPEDAGGGGGDTVFGVPKWAVACAVGGVVVAGLAYYVLSAPPDDADKTPKKKTKKAGGQKSGKSNSPIKKSPSPSSPSPSKKVPVEDLGDDEEDTPTDPLGKAVASKNKGNKYFRGGRYELAIKCYTEAIEMCPKDKSSDLATFYQNRAAAHEQLDKVEAVLTDCHEAVRLNNRYVKALERRARVLQKMSADTTRDPKEKVRRLTTALEDMTSVCFLEGFQKQEHLMTVDTILKDLGSAEARVLFSERTPLLTSKHFIQQYFMSFDKDPIVNGLKEIPEATECVNGDAHSSYFKVMRALKEEEFQDVFTSVNEAVEEEAKEGGSAARLLRLRLVSATFLILSKQLKRAFDELNLIIDDEAAEPEVRANALIKRASMYIQRCQDPETDARLSFNDFAKALEIDPNNPDVYHHRGQVNLLTDNSAKAVEDFEKAIALNPKFPIARVQKLYTEYRMAAEKSDQSGVDGIINAFEEAVAEHPDCVETYALLAQVLCDQGQFERADEFYARAMKVDPSNANLLVHRGLVALQSRGDLVKARELITKAIEIDDKCEFAYETLGTVEVQSGNLNAAVEMFDKAAPLANTEIELGHICRLRSAAKAQNTVSDRLGIHMPSAAML